MGKVLHQIQTVEDARYFAERRLPKGLYQLYEGGTGTGSTLRANLQAFEAVTFRPRGAVFTHSRDLRTRVLGFEISMPVLTAPAGLLRIGHPDGEVGVTRAVGAAGTIQIVSSASGYAIEDIMAVATGPVWYQLFFFRGREGTEPLIDRVKRAGCHALILTIDSAVPAERERSHRDRGALPTGSGIRDALRFAPELIKHPAWFRDFLRDGRPVTMPMALRPDGTPMSIFESIPALYQQTPAWEDVPWIRSQWDGPIVIKGVLTADDAHRAVDSGADGIVVSNHGGNSLDGSPPTLRVLPEIVAAVGDQIEILMDSGVRRGSDVVKAVSLGAKAVLIGRAHVYPCLAAGERGVRKVLEIFRSQIDQTLAFLGCPAVEALDSSYVELPASWTPLP